MDENVIRLSVKTHRRKKEEINLRVEEITLHQREKAVQEQMNDGVTTFIEVVLNQELGEPFRRDAMKTPVSVAGIQREDMRPQV